MKNLTMVILEREPVYGRRLVSYINGRDDSPFYVKLFIEHPVKESDIPEGDIIVMSAALRPEYPWLHQCDHLFFLDEEGRGDLPGQSIYKYQSAATIYQAVVAFCMDMGKKTLTMCQGMGKEFGITGIFTPVMSEAVRKEVPYHQMPWGPGGKFLYMSLEPEAEIITEHLPLEKEVGTMSELIYFVKQRKNNLGNRVEMMAGKGKFDYLLPAPVAHEVDELSEEDWTYLLDALREDTGYEGIVLDLGSRLAKPWLMKKMHQLLIVSSDTPWDARLCDRTLRQLSRMMDEKWMKGVRMEVI